MEGTNGAGNDALEQSNEQENAANYFRLVQLTMVEGTKIVRKTVLNNLQQGKTMHTILAERRSEFFQRDSRLNRQQLDILYPVNGNADLAKIDMTLWFALARKVTNNHFKWCQNLATIHAVRNNLFHLVKPEMDTDIFEDEWTRLTEALYRLDPDLNRGVIERYRTAELNPKAVIELRAMIMEQCFQERCEDLADEVRKRNRIIQLILLVVALVLLAILVGVLVFSLLFKQPRTCDKSLQYRVIGNIGCLYFLPRSGWGAVPPTKPIEPLHLPVPLIIYTHTAEISQCSVTEECCNQVKNIQYLHMHNRKDLFDDIGYHYLIDNKGIVYEGRNITKIASAVHNWNGNITSVAFIGNFMYQTPTVEALASFDLLIAYLRYNNYIIKNYTIYAMCECRNTESPGRILYDEINRSILSHISGHVGHRAEGHCSFNNSVTQIRKNRELQEL